MVNCRNFFSPSIHSRPVDAARSEEGQSMKGQDHELHPIVLLSKHFARASYIRTEFDKSVAKMNETAPERERPTSKTLLLSLNPLSV
jgi:hypothetical protein